MMAKQQHVRSPRPVREGPSYGELKRELERVSAENTQLKQQLAAPSPAIQEAQQTLGAILAYAGRAAVELGAIEKIAAMKLHGLSAATVMLDVEQSQMQFEQGAQRIRQERDQNPSASSEGSRHQAKSPVDTAEVDEDGNPLWDTSPEPSSDDDDPDMI